MKNIKMMSLLQKIFIVVFLQKKLKKNIGEVPQYYVHNSHPVIINPEDWDAVQFEFSKCTEQSNYHNTTNKFLEKIKCTLYVVVYGPNVCIRLR